MRRFGSFLQRISMLALLFAGILATWLLIQTTVLKKALPSIGNYAAAIVLTGSMEPKLSAGDVVILHKQNTYEVKQIITFKERNALVTHRIIKQNSLGFVTKGDANNTADQRLVPLSEIMGAAVFVIPKVGHWLMFVKTPIGCSLLFVLWGLLLFLGGRKGSLEKRKRNM